LIAQHQGREIKSTGDGFLVEFESALKAVQCAANVQRRIFERESEGSQSSFKVRIGIHLGDVVQNGSDILGDAVNIAARIEPLAEPGGVCVSGAVYEQVRSKVAEKFEKLQPKALKGIELPMDVYRMQFPWNNNGSGPAAESHPADPSRLAVLPFANISPDPSDEFFADGLTEELIASLSLIPGLKVIARTSVIGYKKTDKPVATIGKELGVGTIVEGSVRKSANRIRVTVQVIDVATEEHLWTAKYDDNLDDIFAVQGDIASKVATALPGGLKRPASPIPELAKPRETEAYVQYLQGQALMWKTDEASLRQSLEFFKVALRTDPTFARAYAGMARAYIGLGVGSFMSWVDACELGRTASEKAIAIEPGLSDAYGLRAEIAFMADEPADILDHHVRRALELNPNLAQAHSILAALAGSLGIAEAYVTQYEESYRLDPLSPATIRSLGSAYFFAGHYDEAVAHWTKTMELSPLDSLRGLADYSILKGEFAEADLKVKELERQFPGNDLTLLCRGWLSAARGDRVTAMKMIEKLQETSKEGYARQSSVGFIYYALGDIDRFFQVMFATAKAHTMQASRIRMCPLFSGARSDPRFVELFSKYGRPVQPPK
jgi:adenylate cyclase